MKHAWAERNAYRILVAKPDVAGDNIKMDLRDIGWHGINWIHMAQDRNQWRALENMVMNFWGP
jgi:hypothetical protein